MILPQCFRLLNYCSTANKFNYLKAAIHAILNEVHVFQNTTEFITTDSEAITGWKYHH